MEYGNGTIGDMGIHMVDMVRWMMNLGWPKRIPPRAAIISIKKANPTFPICRPPRSITAISKSPGSIAILASSPIRNTGGAPISTAKRAHSKPACSCSTLSRWAAAPIHREWNDPNGKYPVDSDKYPEDKTEKGIEYHVAPAIREHMKDLLQCTANRGRPRADIARGKHLYEHVRAGESLAAIEAEPRLG